MKTGFDDPIAPKAGKTKKSPWDFQCPAYDERTSCYVDAGSHYGIGHKQPMGHTGAAKMRTATLPSGRVNTMQVSKSPPQMLNQEYIQ